MTLRGNPGRTARLLPVALLLAASLAAQRPTCAQDAGAQTAPLPSGVERVTTVEGITEYRLANGLKVLLFPDPSKQTVTVNVTYLVGSRMEGYGETGMAHLLEHMLFKGTPSHPDIWKELTAHGANANGTTWLDRTNYYETVPATDENLDWALRMEADRMVNSSVSRKDLDSEMTVVRNEFESGENDPGSVLMERVLSTAYLWHNYGHPTIGARSDIENVPIERLQAFYRRFYQPDNAVVLVAGKFDPARTLALINETFGAIPRPERTLQHTYTAEPTQDGERSVTLRRVGDVQMVDVVYHIPPGSHPDFPPVDVLTQVLTDTPSGRLYKALVTTKLATDVGGFAFQLREPGIVLFSATVPKGKSLDAARQALIKTVQATATTPPTVAEVQRAKSQLLKNIDLRLNSSETVGLELSEWIAMGDWRLLFLNRDRLQKVTPADVQRVAKAYLKPSNRTVGLYIPTASPVRAEIPKTPDVQAVLKGYKGSATVAAGEAFDPSPANILARTKREATPAGLRLALLPKKTRGAMVRARLAFHFGNQADLRDRDTAASLAGGMLMRGTTRHTRQQIQDELDRLKARVQVGGDATGATASIETTASNLPAVLRLVAEILRQPAFPQAELDELKRQTIASIQEQKSDPQSIAFLEFGRHFHPYPKSDPRYVPTPEEQIARVKGTTLADVRKFYQQFYGAPRGEAAVVGDFDAAQITKLMAGLFSGWKSAHPYARIESPYVAIPPESKTFETPDKANAVFVAATPIQMRDTDANYPALLVANYILGEGGLSSRLGARIRQKEGLSYGVGSFLQVPSLDDKAALVVYAISAPQNTARVEAAAREEIARAREQGFTAEEVKRATAGLLQERELSRAQDAALAGKLASYRFLGRTVAWDADLEEKIRSLTPEQVSAAMRRYVDLARFTVVKAGDFAKAAAR